MFCLLPTCKRKKSNPFFTGLLKIDDWLIHNSLLIVFKCPDVSVVRIALDLCEGAIHDHLFFGHDREINFVLSATQDKRSDNAVDLGEIRKISTHKIRLN